MSFKGVIKKVSGSLKCCALFGPFVIFAGGFIMGVTGVIGHLYNYGKMEESVVVSPEYTQSLNMSIDELQDKYGNGEIDDKEFREQLDDLTSSHYDKYIKSDFPGKENYAANLKRQEQFKIVGFTGLGSFGFGAITSLIWLFTGLGDAISDSMEDDFNWKPPKKPDTSNLDNPQKRKKKSAGTSNSGNQQLEALKESVEEDEDETIDISEL